MATKTLTVTNKVWVSIGLSKIPNKKNGGIIKFFWDNLNLEYWEEILNLGIWDFELLGKEGDVLKNEKVEERK